MIQCKICGKKFLKVAALSIHIRKSHKEITLEKYHLDYLNGIKQYCPVCGKPTRFGGLGESRGYSKYCSTTCVNKSSEHIEAIRNFFQSKYGVDNASQLEEVKEKKRQSYLSHYGVEHFSQTDEYNKKYKDTSLKRYGVDHPSQNINIKRKHQETCIKKYGVDHQFKSDLVKQRRKNTFLERYGVNHVSSIPFVIEKKREKLRVKFFHKLMNSDRLHNLYIPNFTIDQYVDTEKCYSWKCLKCGNNFLDYIYDGRIPRCPICFPKMNKFYKEEELFCFCKEILDNVKQNDRRVLENGLEIDVLMPEKKLGIEFNGLYWHSELQGKDQSYHLKKTLDAKSKGIKLIHIFEDEWVEKQDIIKSIILAKLGKYRKIYARKCDIYELDSIIARDFLFSNHLQGEINGKHIGLFHGEMLVCLLTVGKPRYNKNYEWEILRFCSKVEFQILGGLSKLLSYFIKKYTPNSIITYVDARYGTGESYMKFGFELINMSNPSYYYTKDYISRESRLKYQKHKLSKILRIFDPNLTEWENMQLNGYDRIWDCGNYVYEWRRE